MPERRSAGSPVLPSMGPLDGSAARQAALYTLQMED